MGLDTDLAEKIPYVAVQVPELSRRSCRIPRIIAHAPLGGHGYGWVQERLAGAWAVILDDVLLGDLIELSARLADGPADEHRNDMGWWAPAVLGDIAGWWQTATAISPDAGRFCQRLRAWVGQPRQSGHAHRHDYVHADLNLSNILVTSGRLAGLIDTEHLGVGDSSIDVARLALEWHLLDRAGTAGLAADGRSRLVALGQAISGDAAWRVAVGYELIGRIGWRSEHQARLDPRSLLPACAEFLDAIG